MQSRPTQLIVFTDLLVLSLWKKFLFIFCPIKKNKSSNNKKFPLPVLQTTGELLFLPPGIELLTETRVVTYFTLVLEKLLTKHE